MELDLGAKQVFVVRMGDERFDLSPPTVRQSIEFGKKLKECGEDDLAKTGLLLDFIGGLGMPKEVCEGLTPYQLNKLAEGLMGDPEKKSANGA